MLRLLRLLPLLIAVQCQAQIYLTDSNARYFQDFDGLDSFGTASITFPPGWRFYEWGSAANTSYRAGTGSTTTSDTYSFGPLRSRDRALGSLASGTLTRIVYGTMFINHTGADINAFTLAYRGEQWRRGGSGSPDSLRFWFTTVHGSKLNDTGSASWTEVPALCFTSVSTLTSAGMLNGNDSCRRLRATVPLMLHHGDTVFMRWCDLNAAGSDDGLAIDSVSVSFQNGAVYAGNHPQVISFSPDSNTAGLSPDLSLQLGFDRAVRPGSGNVYIRNTTTLKTDTIQANRGQFRSLGREVLFSGIRLSRGESYQVRFDSTAFDSSGYASIGLYDSSWSFRIEKLGVNESGTEPGLRVNAMSGGKILIQSGNGASEQITLRIYDADGRLQFRKELHLTQANMIVDPELPARGCYLVIVNGAENRLSTRVCKAE